MIGSTSDHSSSGTRQIGGSGSRSFLGLPILHLLLSMRCRPGASLEIGAKIDLLFFHRRLRALVAIDLKVGEFEAGYKGQMELYLRYLEKYEQLEGETSPVGLILCTGKNEEHVELMRLEQSNIRVADYLTLLPPPETLRAKLHQSIALARRRLQNRE